MKTKIFTSMILSILSLVMLIGIASAATNFTVSTNTLTFSEDANQTITITDFLGGQTFTPSPASLSFGDSTFDISIVNTTATIDPSVFDVSALDFGQELSGTFNINSDGGESEVITVITKKTNPCTYDDDNGDFTVTIDGIEVLSGFGEDEEWFPFDEIEIEIEVENDGDDDLNNVEIAWGLYNADDDTWYIDDEEKDFDVKDGDKETKIISFRLDDDIDELESGDYTFYVWANGEIEDDADTPVCSSDSEDITIEIENDFVILDDITLPESVQCGGEFQVTADAWNIGEDDQDEVYVRMKNGELNFDEKITIGDINAFEDEALSATFKIPTDAVEKSYNLVFEVYNEDDDIYENDYDDEESMFELELVVSGSCILASQPVISVSLESDAKAGEELVIKVSVTNVGTKANVFVVQVDDYDSWSETDTSMGILTVQPGETGENTFTFNVDKDASGDKTFNVEVLVDNEIVLSQPVSVSIEQSGTWARITGGAIGDNWYLWGIGALNIILIVVIILVAVRIARR